MPSNLRRALLLLPTLGAGFVTLAWRSYRKDLQRACDRIANAGSQVVDTPCGPIEYAEAGSGLPLLVVHGAGGGFDQGLDFAGSLPRRGFRVIAVSRFGYLRTPLPDDASPIAQADAHACLLDTLGIERTAIMGGSAGAPSAMQFAIRHPDRCSALVLLVPLAGKPSGASMPPVAPSTSRERTLMRIVGSDFAFWLTAKLSPELVIRTILATPPEVLHAASRGEKARIDRIVSHVLPIRHRWRGISNDSRIAASLPPYPLDQVTAPTLVMSARDDLYGTYANAEYVASRIAGARFVGYASGGHTWVGHDAEVLAEIAGFVSAAASARAGATAAALTAVRRGNMDRMRKGASSTGSHPAPGPVRPNS
jgi:pimeloyl-ACP methyl ester carboxylesterase